MKLPFSFNTKLIFRLILPGFIVSLSSLPIAKALAVYIEPSITIPYLLIVSTIIVGWLFTALDMNIYMLAEGRRYWPPFLHKLSLDSEKKRLEKLLSEFETAGKKDRIKNMELSVKIRQFPINENGERYAQYPTKLGNLIAAYEQYPMNAYGMDSIFYWYRIWLSIDDSTREHIDNQQALADSVLYVTFSLYISSLLLLLYSVIPTFGLELYFSWKGNLTISILLSLSGWFLYRSTLHVHNSFGELYKSLFDIHKDKVPVDKVLDEVSSLLNCSKDSLLVDKYQVVWRYLHNNKVKTSDGMIPVAKIKKGE